MAKAGVSQLTYADLPVPPVLAVEVLSRSTRSRDLVRKRAAYEHAGLDHFWLVGPLGRSVTVLERVDGCFATSATATGDQPVSVLRPFPVTVVPAELGC